VNEVAFVLFAVTRLFERAQHEVGEDAFFGCAGDFGGEPLVHLRGDGDLFGDFVDLRRFTAAAVALGVGAGVAPVGFHGEALDREGGEA
jgi:hypothetical protein